MKLSRICLIGGVALVVVLAYGAAWPRPELPRRLPEALPAVADLSGFRSNAGVQRASSLPGYVIDTWRMSDHARLTMGVQWMPTAEDAKQWPSRRNASVQSPLGYLRRVATPRGIRAGEVWTNISPDRGPFSVAVIDGRCVVSVLFAPGIGTTERGFGRQYGHSADDLAFVHRLLARAMDRLTVAGLTTRSPDSVRPAPASAPPPRRDGRR